MLFRQVTPAAVLTVMLATVHLGCTETSDTNLFPTEETREDTLVVDTEQEADSGVDPDTVSSGDAADTAPDTATPSDALPVPVCVPPCDNGGVCTADDRCDCFGTGHYGSGCATPGVLADVRLTLDVSDEGARLASLFQGSVWTDVKVKSDLWGWSELPMRDDGTGSDLAAGDGVFTWQLSESEVPLPLVGDSLELVFVLGESEYRVSGIASTEGAEGFVDFGEGVGFEGVELAVQATGENNVVVLMPCPLACANGGSCVSPGVCDCTPGWLGPYCEAAAVCAPQCQHGGRCVADNVCACEDTAYRGALCDVPCTPSGACENGGTCTGASTCSCPASWSGGRCEVPVCEPGCENSGACVAPDTCACDGTGYSGPTCATPVCTLACANGGTCTGPNTCSCPAGWAGATCAAPGCGGVECPDLEGYGWTCNAAEHCEYASDSTTPAWLVDTVWIYVPPGSFPMGSPSTEADHSPSEDPVHTVTFAQGFFMQKYPVTTRVYEACEGAGVCTAPSVADWSGGGWGLNRTSNARGEHPQNGVAWAQAEEVCGWLGGRRPSEAEWEYAAKGPTTHRKYPWGDAPEPTCANDTAVFNETGATVDYGCGQGGTWAVGAKAAGASAVGALDMSGNIYEWTEDCWHSSYSGAPNDGAAWTTDCSVAQRVLRGGGFAFTAPLMRAAARSAGPPSLRGANLGARCVRPLP